MKARSRTALTASLLGLPIALLAHALVFGGEHAAGGALSTAALAAAALGLLFVVALHSRSLVQGSILAARLRNQLPSFATLAASGSLSFAGLEMCERAHTAPILAIIVALIAACYLVRAAVAAVAKSIAHVAIVLAAGLHVPALSEAHARVQTYAPHFARSFAHTRRLFSRPPPVLS